MLLKYELKKIWDSRILKGLLLAVVLLNAFGLWHFDAGRLQGVKELNRVLEPLSQEERLAFIQDAYETLNHIALVEQAQHLLAFSHMELAQTLLEQLETENPGILEAYLPLYLEGGFLRFTDSLHHELALVGDFYDEFQALSNYSTHIENILHHGRISSQVFVFGAEGFSRENILRTLADFEGRQDIPITLASSMGIRFFSDSLLTDVLAMVYVLVLAGTLFFEEKEKGLLGLIKAAPKGRLATAAAKYTVLLAALFPAVILLYGTNLAFYHIMAGYGELGRTIQSARNFQNSILDLTMGGYLLITIISKWGVLAIIGLIASIAAVAKYAAAVYVVPSALLTLSWLLFHGLSSGSPLNALKYLNLWGLMQPDLFLGHYLNLNLSGFPVNLHLGAFLGGILIFFILSAVLLAAYSASRQIQAFSVKFERFKWRIPAHIFSYEGYKLLMVNRGLLVMGVFTWAVLSPQLSNRFTPSTSEAVYRHYMTQLAGEITPEKSAFLEGERLRFEGLGRQLLQLHEELEQELISLQAFESRSRPILQQQQFEGVFWRVWERYGYLQERGGHFVYDTGFNDLLDVEGRRGADTALVLGLMALLCFYQSFAMDAGLRPVLRTTPRGRRVLANRKVLWAAVLAAFFVLTLEVSRFIGIGRDFGLEGLTAPALSLPALSRLPAFVTIGSWLLVFWFLKWVLAFSFALMVLCLSQKLSSGTLALMGGGAALLVIPLLVSLGFGPLSWLSLIPVMSLNHFLDARPVLMGGYVLLLLCLPLLLYRIILKLGNNE